MLQTGEKIYKKPKKSSGIIPAKLGRSWGGGKRLVQHPKAGTVDSVTGAGARTCAGHGEAPADGGLVVLIFLVVLIVLIFPNFLIFPVFLIFWGFC